MERCRAPPLLALLLLMLTAASVRADDCPLSVADPLGGQTEVVDSDAQLLRALSSNNVTRILLSTNIVLGA